MSDRSHLQDPLGYLYEELSPEDMTRARAHLTECRDCLREIKAIRETVKTYRALPRVRTPLDLRAGVMERIRDLDRQPVDAEIDPPRVVGETVAPSPSLLPSVLYDEKEQIESLRRFRWRMWFFHPAWTVAASVVFICALLVHLSPRRGLWFDDGTPRQATADASVQRERASASAPSTPREDQAKTARPASGKAGPASEPIPPLPPVDAEYPPSLVLESSPNKAAASYPRVDEILSSITPSRVAPGAAAPFDGAHDLPESVAPATAMPSPAPAVRAASRPQAEYPRRAPEYGLVPEAAVAYGENLAHQEMLHPSDPASIVGLSPGHELDEEALTALDSLARTYSFSPAAPPPGSAPGPVLHDSFLSPDDPPVIVPRPTPLDSGAHAIDLAFLAGLQMGLGEFSEASKTIELLMAEHPAAAGKLVRMLDDMMEARATGAVAESDSPGPDHAGAKPEPAPEEGKGPALPPIPPDPRVVGERLAEILGRLPARPKRPPPEAGETDASSEEREIPESNERLENAATASDPKDEQNDMHAGSGTPTGTESGEEDAERRIESGAAQDAVEDLSGDPGDAVDDDADAGVAPETIGGSGAAVAPETSGAIGDEVEGEYADEGPVYSGALAPDEAAGAASVDDATKPIVGQDPNATFLSDISDSADDAILRDALPSEVPAGAPGASAASQPPFASTPVGTPSPRGRPFSTDPYVRGD
ncbi:MAG: hypothetical protein LBJ46_11665 [Planctomycetota bacterium]|jgi:hypothetical protein|nr:hypothetical protein [Planctomycetota bacterium]